MTDAQRVPLCCLLLSRFKEAFLSSNAVRGVFVFYVSSPCRPYCHSSDSSTCLIKYPIYRYVWMYCMAGAVCGESGSRRSATASGARSFSFFFPILVTGLIAAPTRLETVPLTNCVVPGVLFFHMAQQ